MVNLKAISILIVLLVLYISVIYAGVRESFTNKTIEKENNDCGCNESSDEKEEYVDDEKDTNVETEIASKNSVVSDSIVIKDTVRRESKIPSSLGFTYLDEHCEVRKDKYPNFPVTQQDIQKTEPITPLIDNENQHVNFQEVYGTNIKGVLESSNVEKLEYNQDNSTPKNDYKKMSDFHSEMFDDSELKPKPNMNAPYGFVYFPNKYWKEWQRKLPVCTPTSKCKVLPTYTQGAPVDVLDYTQVGSIMPKFKYSEEFEEQTCS